MKKIPHGSHPALFIQEEMKARGWSIQDLALKMTQREFNVNQLSLELYFACVGSEYEENCSMGERMALAISSAFGVSKDLLLNLEKQYQSTQSSSKGE